MANQPRLDWVPPAAGVVALPWVVDATDTEVERAYRNLAETRGTCVVEPSQLREGLTQLVFELDHQRQGDPPLTLVRGARRNQRLGRPESSDGLHSLGGP